MKKFKAAGMLVYKVEAIGQPGFPDLLLVRPGGAACFVEVKTPHGRLRALQRYTIERELIPQGAEVYVVRSIEDAESVIAGSDPAAAAGD